MKIKFVFFFVLGFIGFDQAQITNTSLYSRFALGELHDPVTVSQSGMAGLSLGLVKPLIVNYKNAAALSFVSQPTFSIGIKSEQVIAANSEVSQKNSVTQFDHFVIAFPVAKNKAGMAFGLAPYSIMNYQYRDSSMIQSLEDPVLLEYSGSGGINTMFLKSAYKMILAKDTSEFHQHAYASVGLGLTYYFGSLTNAKRVEFPHGSGFINSFIADKTSYNDIGLDFGILLRTYLKKKTETKGSSTALNLGFNYHPTTKLTGEQSKDVFSYLFNNQGVETSVDLVSSSKNQSGYVNLPSQVGVGATLDFYYKKKEASSQRNLLIGADYTLNNWDELETSFLTLEEYSEVNSTSSMSLGISYKPNIDFFGGNVSNYFQACTYRIGYRSKGLNLTLKDQSIMENGINLGISLPLVYGLKQKVSDTSIDLSIGYGNRGTTENNLVKEDYYRFKFGISFRPLVRDRWFVKRKYD